MLDVGGESTRPQGAMPVSDRRGAASACSRCSTRCARAIPDVPISVDTVKSAVAREALAHGARGDQRCVGLSPRSRDGGRVRGGEVRAWSSCTRAATSRHGDVCARRGTATTSWARSSPSSGARVEWAREAGVARERIAIDPGIGFAKRTRALAARCCASCRASRRSGCRWRSACRASGSSGELSGATELEDRVDGTIGGERARIGRRSAHLSRARCRSCAPRARHGVEHSGRGERVTMFEQLRFLTSAGAMRSRSSSSRTACTALLLLLHGTRAVQMLIGHRGARARVRARVAVQAHDDHLPARHRLHVRRVRGARDLPAGAARRRSRTSASRASTRFFRRMEVSEVAEEVARSRRAAEPLGHRRDHRARARDRARRLRAESGTRCRRRCGPICSRRSSRRTRRCTTAR